MLIFLSIFQVMDWQISYGLTSITATPQCTTTLVRFLLREALSSGSIKVHYMKVGTEERTCTLRHSAAKDVRTSSM